MTVVQFVGRYDAISVPTGEKSPLQVGSAVVLVEVVEAAVAPESVAVRGAAVLVKLAAYVLCTAVVVCVCVCVWWLLLHRCW